MYDFLWKDSKPLSFDELDEMVKYKRKLIKRSYYKGMNIILHFKETLFSCVIFDMQLYMSIAVFVISRYLRNTELAYLPSLPLQPLTIIAALYSFLLVFYMTMSYNRYFAQYELVKACEG